MSGCIVCSSLDTTKMVAIPNCNTSGKGPARIWNEMCIVCAKKYEGDYYVKDI